MFISWKEVFFFSEKTGKFTPLFETLRSCSHLPGPRHPKTCWYGVTWDPARNIYIYVYIYIHIYMDVSENSGFSPQIIHLNKVFHYKPSFLGYPYFWKHPYTHIYTYIYMPKTPNLRTGMTGSMFWDKSGCEHRFHKQCTLQQTNMVSWIFSRDASSNGLFFHCHVGFLRCNPCNNLIR